MEQCDAQRNSLLISRYTQGQNVVIYNFGSDLGLTMESREVIR
jgi:hypothetical protein